MAILGQAGLLKPIFLTPEVNPHGAYCFRFYRAGAWETIIIDDYLPTSRAGGLVFAKSRERDELWVPLLEKAYAKFYGGFDELVAGCVCDALRDMTGGTGQVVNLHSEGGKAEIASGALWERIKRAAWSAQRRGGAASGTPGVLLGCGSCSGSDTTFTKAGIVNGHAYSILEVYETTVDSGASVKLLKLRNPWGSGQEVRARSAPPACCPPCGGPDVCGSCPASLLGPRSVHSSAVDGRLERRVLRLDAAHEEGAELSAERRRRRVDG